MVQDVDTKSLTEFRVVQLERENEQLRAMLKEIQGEQKRKNEQLETKINETGLLLAKLSERMTLFQFFQAGLSAVLSAISAAVSR